MHSRRMLYCSLAGAWMLAGCSIALSQVNTGTILGTITDSSGAAVPKAVVTVTHVATQATQSVVTSESGAHIFERLPIGEYRLHVKAEGFKQSERRDIRLDATQRVKIDVPMELGGVTESVTVAGGASLVAPRTPNSASSSASSKCATCP